MVIDMAGPAVAALTAGEGAVLTAARRWFGQGTVAAMDGIRRSLGRVGVPVGALLPLFTLLGLLAADRRHTLVLRPVGHGGLAVDEAVLLDVLAAAQAGEDDVVMDVLSRWLPEVALCAAVAATLDFGRALADSGVRLPGGRSGGGFGLTLALAAE